MRTIGTAPSGHGGKERQSKTDPIEQWVAEQLAVAPDLSAAQLGHLQALLAVPCVVEAKSA